MASNALQLALSQDALLKAWRELYAKTSPKSRNTVGIDGVSINDFEPYHKQHIARLSREIRDGTYNFLPLKPSFIPKATPGKFRLISVPAVRDRVVQRALVNHLSKKYHAKLANEISYGFVNGRSVKEAAERACALRKTHPWVFKTDIVSFFDKIDRELMASAIRKQVTESSLHGILLKALNCEVDESDRKSVKRLAQLNIKRGSGVRQGMPLSPLFSNLLLVSFDRQMHKRGAKAVRYADDLIFFAQSEKDCYALEALCRAEFQKLKLTIPIIEASAKSVIYSPSESAEFLGLELASNGGGYELRLSTNQILAIRDEMLQFGSVKELLARGITLKTLGPLLTAKRSGYLAAYEACTNLNDIEANLSDLEEKILKRIYRDGLGIDLNTIGNEARRFLGLR